MDKLSTTQKGLSAGGIAAVVIGIGAAIGFMTYGGKKGYDYLTGSKGELGAVQNNPLYEEMKPNDNPLYEGKDDIDLEAKI